MKKTALQICSLVGLVILIAVASGNAQTQYRAHIPFDFTINQKTYEAGDYSIDVLNSDSAPKLLAIRDVKGRNSHMLIPTLGEDHSKVEIATLVFNRFETQYSLAAIRTPSFTVILPISKAAAKATLARNQNAPQTTVALTKKN